MAEQQQSRTLSKDEFEAIRQRVLAEAPPDLSEADFYRWAGPRMASAIAEAEQTPPIAGPDAQGGLRRAVGSAAHVLNPANLVEGGLDMIASPIDTAKQVWGAMGDQATKAREAFGEGRYSESLGHGIASAVPVLGPAAAAAGERIAGGDIAGGLGEAAALGALSSPSLIRGAAKTARAAIPAGARESLAGALDRGAAERVAGVMRPEIGPNKNRFGNIAADVAPELLARGNMRGLWSREGLHGTIQDGLSNAERLLDEAANARLSARTFSTQPIIDALLERRRRLTAETVEASKAIPGFIGEGGRPNPSRIVRDIPTGRMKPELGKQARPFGEDVVPAPNRARVAQIDQALAEIRQLGPQARYESLRRIREAYDGPAKAVYSPSMTADYLSSQGGKLGAADVTGVLRESLARFDPATSAANAEYHLFRSADDVLRATAEVQRTRPKVGRAIMARLTGVFGGSQAAGAPGAVAGFVLGPTLETAVSSGFTTRLQTARLMAGLADAIRNGNVQSAATIAARIKGLVARAAQIQGGASTSPSAYQLPKPLVVR